MERSEVEENGRPVCDCEGCREMAKDLADRQAGLCPCKACRDRRKPGDQGIKDEKFAKAMLTTSLFIIAGALAQPECKVTMVSREGKPPHFTMHKDGNVFAKIVLVKT